MRTVRPEILRWEKLFELHRAILVHCLSAGHPQGALEYVLELFPEHFAEKLGMLSLEKTLGFFVQLSTAPLLVQREDDGRDALQYGGWLNGRQLMHSMLHFHDVLKDA